MGRTGAGNPGPAASKLLDLGNPRIDWVSLAGGLGLPAERVSTPEAFDEAFERAMNQTGRASSSGALGITSPVILALVARTPLSASP
jgi:acetolactate synthase-1/2/3 large subunit